MLETCSSQRKWLRAPPGLTLGAPTRQGSQGRGFAPALLLARHSQRCRARGCRRSSAATVPSPPLHFREGQIKACFQITAAFLNHLPTPAPWERSVREPHFPVLLPALQSDRGTSALPGRFASALNRSSEAFQGEMLLCSEVTHNH